MGRGLDLSGQKFNRLYVIEDSGERYGKPGKGVKIWKCICKGSDEKPHEDVEVFVRTDHLKSGNTTSCGCALNDRPPNNLIHGMCGTPEHRAYKLARRRCNNPNSNDYKTHGAKGIKFLFETFEEFYNELGPRPTTKHSVDRFPNKRGNYEPGNVRWATPEEQAQNAITNVLNPNKVRNIRECGSEVSVEFLAHKYKCSLTTIYDVLNHKTWKNI